MDESPNTSKYVRSVFQMTQMPDNVRISRWYDNMRISRLIRSFQANVARHIFGSSVVSSVGKFAFNCNGRTSEIEFDGRNAQFHALYERFFRNGYEIETAILIVRLASDFKVFYDIGSNWGYFSMLLAASPGFSGKIFAFEPNPVSYNDLERTVQQAGLGNRITTLNYGLGRAEETLRLEEVEKYQTGLTRLTNNGSGRRVPVHTLDSIELPPADVIKIDAEGMESDIFLGGVKMLEEQRPFIIFENILCFDDPNRTLAPLSILRDKGYRLFNPALIFECGDRTALASYGDPVDSLLECDPNPKTALIETTETTRFLMRRQLNLFACHESRIDELWPKGFVQIHGF